MSGQVAPHEGRELLLVKAGTKPLGVLEKTKRQDTYSLLLGQGTKLYPELSFQFTQDEVVFTLLENKDLILYYNLLVGSSPEFKATKTYNRYMGKLFGYSDEDIEEFINNPPDCTCEKCGG